MANRSTKSIILKLAAFWALFLLLHFAHNWIPTPVIAVFSGTSEGVAQHIKLSFWAYTLASIGEYFILRVPKKDRLSFFDSRLLAVLFVSLGTFLWYLVPAIRGVGMPNDLLEIIYANLVILLVGLGTIVLERDFTRIQLSRGGRIAAISFYLVLGSILIIGSFTTPWGGFWVMK